MLNIISVHEIQTYPGNMMVSQHLSI